MEGVGFGLAALAFWAFIASCVIGGVWYAIREKQAQHETVRRIIESGRDIDAEVIDRIMNDRRKSKTDFRVGAYITMSVTPGLALLGYVLEIVSDNDRIFTIMLGVAGLVFFVAIGLLVASKVVERSAESKGETPLS
jgi:uncharacterized protein YneF (UPF0154 family)